MVGGLDGLEQDCIKRASSQWSLSPFTLPHPLARILLVKKIYHAVTINIGHPYRR
ncbi:MAG: hypothetical protein COA46_01580 [Porticoccaceae bacterium]|nr:MAG: hypothetical protein COA46_01580 [Porticoccaceae bacterium]